MIIVYEMALFSKSKFGLYNDIFNWIFDSGKNRLGWHHSNSEVAHTHMAVDAENYIAEIFYYFHRKRKLQTTSFVGNYSAVDADYSAEKFAEKMAE